VPLKDNNALVLSRKTSGESDTVSQDFNHSTAAQPGHFSGMRRDDQRMIPAM
jgi:hypothetical protein